MNAISIINKVKYSKWLYKIYCYVGSFLVKVVRLFVKPQENLIVFASFGGRKYDDSPRAVFERVIKDKRFDGFELVWAFIYPDSHDVPRAVKIKIDTPKYYLTLLRARVWVTNSSMTRGLHFKGKKTFVLNTWHGSAIKKMGSDIQSSNTSFKIKGKNQTDVMLAQGDYDVEVFSHVFNIDPGTFRVFGLPRNDELVWKNNAAVQLELKKKLGVAEDKKVILYAPTFREYCKDSSNNCVMESPVNLDLWRRELGEDYVLLFRAHYEVVASLNITDDDFVKDVSAYPQLNDLILASDMLVSDYSSIFFDYSITGKPMLCYAYDYERYSQERGLYFDIREKLGCENIKDEGQLLDAIRNMDVENREMITKSFRSQYVQAFGNASEKVVDMISDALRVPSVL